MEVPSHMHITASLMAGYTFLDGSLVEVDSNGDYRITDPEGKVLAETADTEPGEGKGLNFGMPPADYGEIMDDLAAFLQYDAGGVDDPSDFEDGTMFGLEAKAWAQEHEDELSELACYREDKRLAEEA